MGARVLINGTWYYLGIILAPCSNQQPISGLAHAAEIELGFNNAHRQLNAFLAGGAGNLFRQRSNLFGQRGVTRRRQTQSVPKRIVSRSPAALKSRRPPAPSRVGAVGGNLSCAAHDGVIPLIAVSITLTSLPSIS